MYYPIFYYQRNQYLSKTKTVHIYNSYFILFNTLKFHNFIIFFFVNKFNINSL